MRFGLKTNVFVLCTTICLMQTGIYSWYKILPIYLKEKGASAEQIGLAFTLITVAYRVPQVIGGLLSDILGAHVTTICGTLLMGIGLIALSWCQDWQVLLVGLCGLFGVGALMYPGQLTLLTHSVPADFKGQAIGFFDGCTILGYLLGPILGAMILVSFHHNSFQILLILSGVIYLAMGAIRYRYLSANLAVLENESALVPPPSSGQQWVVGGLTLLLSMAGFLVYYLLWDGPFSAMYLNDTYGLSKTAINFHSTLACVFAVISAILSSRMVDKIGTARFLMMMFLMIAGIASLFIIPWFLGTQMPIGLGYLTTALMVIPVEGYFIAYQKMVTSLGSKKNRAFWVGFFGTLMGLVPAAGIHLGGVLYSDTGMVGPMILVLSTSAIGAFLAYCMMMIEKVKINSWFEYLDADTIRRESPQYKDARVALARLIKKNLNQTPFVNRWFLDGGTLLGVWRNSKIIDHDYDFDFGLHGTPEELWNLEEALKKAFKNDPNILIKSEKSYATKLMVIDQSHGKFKSSIEWWKVYADIQLYTIDESSPKITRMQYFKDNFIEREYRTEWFGPMKEVLLKDDGENWPVPAQDIEVLKTTYGYLGENALFDPQTKLYVKAN